VPSIPIDLKCIGLVNRLIVTPTICMLDKKLLVKCIGVVNTYRAPTIFMLDKKF